MVVIYAVSLDWPTSPCSLVRLLNLAVSLQSVNIFLKFSRLVKFFALY